MATTTTQKFYIREFTGSSFAEKIWLYDEPENNECDDLEDARAKCEFAFTDNGKDVEWTSDCDFVCDGQEYRLFIK